MSSREHALHVRLALRNLFAGRAALDVSLSEAGLEAELARTEPVQAVAARAAEVVDAPGAIPLPSTQPAVALQSFEPSPAPVRARPKSAPTRPARRDLFASTRKAT